MSVGVLPLYGIEHHCSQFYCVEHHCNFFFPCHSFNSLLFWNVKRNGRTTLYWRTQTKTSARSLLNLNFTCKFEFQIVAYILKIVFQSCTGMFIRGRSSITQRYYWSYKIQTGYSILKIAKTLRFKLRSKFNIDPGLISSHFSILQCFWPPGSVKSSYLWMHFVMKCNTSVKCRRIGEVKVVFYAWYPSNRYFTTEGHSVSKVVSRYYIYPRNASFYISEISGETAT